MTNALSVAVLSSLLLAAAPCPAQHPAVPPLAAVGAVRSYFEAFRRLDDRALVAVTEGQATSDTRGLLDQIREEARRNHVKVELQLANLFLRQTRTDGVSRVEAWFDMNVIAKKWIFSKVAKELRGRATFYFGQRPIPGDRSGTKITGIKLDLF